jgi:Ca-activated chloride channel homolog
MPHGAAAKGGYGGFDYGAADGADDEARSPSRSAAAVESLASYEDARSVGSPFTSPQPDFSKFAEQEADTGASGMGPGERMRVLFSSQSASGLWEEQGKSAILVTTETLLALLNLGLTTADAVHGALLKKAIDALLLALSTDNGTDAKVRELALGIAWLLTTGHRTRQAIEANAANASLQLFEAANRNETAVRQRVDQLAVLSLP